MQKTRNASAMQISDVKRCPSPPLWVSPLQPLNGGVEEVASHSSAQRYDNVVYMIRIQQQECVVFLMYWKGFIPYFVQLFVHHAIFLYVWFYLAAVESKFPAKKLVKRLLTLSAAYPPWKNLTTGLERTLKKGMRPTPNVHTSSE